MRIVFLFIMLPYILFSQSLPLVFVGNDKLSSRDLYDVIGLRLPYAIEIWEEKPVIKSQEVAQSIAALVSFYRSKGYFETKITSQENNSSILLTIEENEPIRVADIQINSLLDVDYAVELKLDGLFDQEKFAQSKLHIKKRYGDMGYCNGTFNSKAWVDLVTHQAHVLFEATPNDKCTFGAISVASTPNIDGTIAASMLQLETGDTYSLEAIQKSYEALYAQEGIARVSINDTDRNGSVVPISVDIDEVERPIRFSAGLGMSSDQGFGAQMGIRHRNILGDLKTLSLDGQFTQIKQEAAATLAIPLRNHLFGYGEVGYRDEEFSGYRSQSVYEKLTLKQQGIPTSILIAMLFDQAKTYDSTNPEAFPNSNVFIPSPIVELNIDTRDKLLEPTRGDWFNVKAQGSVYSGISDATYFKTVVAGAHIQSFGEHVIAGRLQWGMLRLYEGDAPSSYRFYAGGMNSNRAYTYRDLGPQDVNGDPIGFRSLLEGTLEYRFPVYDSFRGVLFSDITYGSDNYLPDYSNPYLAVGPGFRYVTPIGPIAVDLGVDPNDTSQYAIHFRIGELF